MKQSTNLTVENNTESAPSPYRNHVSLLLEPLSNYSPDQLFITEDNYCFVISEYVEFIKSKAYFLDSYPKFVNPYTITMMSERDISKLLKIPEIHNIQKALYEKQTYYATKISKETIAQLVLLAEGLLNKQEIFASTKDPVPIAQRACDIFTPYYNAMPKEERDCLNAYWIGEWKSIKIQSKFSSFGGTYNGHGAIRFKDLYDSFDSQCSHTIAGCIVKLVKQLEPDTQFTFSGPLANITQPTAHIINNAIEYDNSVEKEIITMNFHKPRPPIITPPSITKEYSRFGLFNVYEEDKPITPSRSVTNWKFTLFDAATCIVTGIIISSVINNI